MEIIALTVRESTIEDAKNIWVIRNNPLVRMFSGNHSKIGYERHCLWYKKQYFESKKNHCFVLEHDHKVIGYCRFDLIKSKIETSLAIDPRYHGKGYGSHLLALSLRHLKPKKIVFAEVLRDNIASVEVFKKNNFTICKVEKDTLYLEYTHDKVRP